MSWPNFVYYDEPNDDGTRHNSTQWRDESDADVWHRESYDYDSEGNVTGYHYGQVDQSDGTQVTYNYHTNSWEEK